MPDSDAEHAGPHQSDDTSLAPKAQKLPWSTPRLYDLTQADTASGTFDADTETKYEVSTGLFHLYAPNS